MSLFEKWQIFLSTATLIITLFIGWQANTISSRVKDLQDYVAIAVGPADSQIELTNTGKINVYLWGFDIPGNNQRFDNGRLIPVADNYNYWIPTPDFSKIGNDFTFKLYLTDQYGNKYISEGAGQVISQKKIGLNISYTYRIWSYHTKESNWKF